jgi:hypothetical protein
LSGLLSRGSSNSSNPEWRFEQLFSGSFRLRLDMRQFQGGTQKWCPNCEGVQVCTAVSPTQLGEESAQRWYRSDHDDIRWFRRGQVCQQCGHKWLSAEVPEDFVNELVELRDALNDIKVNAEAYVAESKKAASRLDKLTDSLQVLRALKIYKKQR